MPHKPSDQTLTSPPSAGVTGTKANEQISTYIIEQLKNIQKESQDRSKTDPSTPQVEISEQYPSGSLNFEFLSTVITNVYTNLTNIVARISFGEESKKSAILVNSHFDTPMDSPGAMDARTCISTMLELTRAITNRRLNHSVIFLFNGAEESLQVRPNQHSFPLYLGSLGFVC